MLNRRRVITGLAATLPLTAQPAWAQSTTGARTGATGELTTKHGFNDEQIEWLFLEDGLTRAQEITRPILMLAHATWCPHCRQTKNIYRDAEVVDLMQWYVPVLVDIDRQPEISQRYAPDGDYVPRHMILMPDGTHVTEAKGPYEEYDYLIPYLDSEWLQYFLKKSYQQVKARDEASRS